MLPPDRRLQLAGAEFISDVSLRKNIASFFDEYVEAIPAEARDRYQLRIRIDSAGHAKNMVETAAKHSSAFSITNAQTVVGDAHQVIVVTRLDNCSTDSLAFADMLDEVICNYRRTPAQVLADTG